MVIKSVLSSAETGVSAERRSDLLAARKLRTQQGRSLEDETTSNFGQHKASVVMRQKETNGRGGVCWLDTHSTQLGLPLL